MTGSIPIPQYYITINRQDGGAYTVNDLQSLKLTRSVTESIASFDLRVAHGGVDSATMQNDFTRYNNADVWKEAYIFLGTDGIGSTMLLNGKIDTIKSEFSSEGGYITTFTGRDTGEALFRQIIRKDYFGYYQMFPSGSKQGPGVGRGTVADGWDTHILTQPFQTDGKIYDIFIAPYTEIKGMIIRFNGDKIGGSIYPLYPFLLADSSISSLPSDCMKTGLVTELPFSVIHTGSSYCLLTAGLQNYQNSDPISNPVFAHGGFLWARLWGADDTGSMSNLVQLSDWCNNIGAYPQTGSTITFPQNSLYNYIDTILIPFTTKPNNQFIYIEFCWQITTPEPPNEYQGLVVDLTGKTTSLSIPTIDYGTAVMADILNYSPEVIAETMVLDTTPITTRFDGIKVFDALKDVADTINYDFYIDSDSHLHAFPRQTMFTNYVFEENDNILKFNRNKDIDIVRNHIWVRGAAESLLPPDGDIWTENKDGWDGTGTGSGDTDIYDVVYYAQQQEMTPVYGNSYLYLYPHEGWTYPDGTTSVLIRRPIGTMLSYRKGESGSLKFNLAVQNGVSFIPPGWTSNDRPCVRLKASLYDYNNYFVGYIVPKEYFGGGGTAPFSIPLEQYYPIGPDYEITADNKNGVWKKIGNMSWTNVKYIELYLHYTFTGQPAPGVGIDGLRFEGVRWSGSATDTGSVLNYGFRYYEETSDDYHSIAECVSRAEKYLKIKKNPINQITMTVTGSTQINPGDRVKVLIPTEAITGSDGTGDWFDVIEMTHNLSSQGFTTDLVVSDQKFVRSLSELSTFGVQRYYDKKDIQTALQGKVTVTK